MTAVRPIAGARAHWRDVTFLPALVAVLLIPAFLGSSSTIFNDGDVSWHIATGQWILDHHAIPHTDPFSFTWRGKPWVPIEWLSELIYALAYRLGGYSGIAAVVTAALIALHALVYSSARQWIAMNLVPVVAMDFALIPMLSARPHVLALPLLALWMRLLLRAREKDRAPPLFAALLMTIWANLHGSFVFGFALVATFALEAVWMSRDKERAFREWFVFGLACTAAVFINGNGVAGVLYPLRFTQFRMLPLIDEWKPANLGNTPFFFGALVITIALIAWKRPRLSFLRWLLLSGLLGLAMLQVRHEAMFAIIAALILPQGFAHGQKEPVPEIPFRTIIGCACAAFVVTLRAFVPLDPPEGPENPWQLIAQVPTSLRNKPVLNDYSMGGPLILSGIRPYIDGRGDMYGDELVLGYARAISGDPNAFAQTVQRWDIRWAILANGSNLVPVIDRTPGWQALHRDRVGTIFVRSD